MKVIYIDIDSLRPDHLHCYGYKRPTSPNIDRLAMQSMRFAQCYTSDSPCMPSRAALISGTFGIRTGIVTHGTTGLAMPLHTRTIPAVLREHGVRTAAFSTFGRHPSPWFYMEWEEFHDPRGWRFQQTPAWKMNEQVLPWIEENAQDDFFLYVQYWDPHAIYDAPHALVNAMSEHDLPAFPDDEAVARHQNDRFWHSASMMGIHSYDKYAAMVNEYDAEIRYVDFHVGQILDLLERKGILDETMIIIAADHGEGLGEHGVYVEHWSIVDTVNHIPLIVKFPRGAGAGRTCQALVYQFDIAATICEAFQIAKPIEWDSESLWPYLDEKNVKGRSHLVIGHGLYTAQRGVVTDRWKLIRTLHSGEWNYPDQQLFDRESDVYEQTNVWTMHQDMAKILNGYLADWEYQNRATLGYDPLVSTAHQGPPGLHLYGKETMEDFYVRGIPQRVTYSERKPDIPALE
ncbi:hypothetical protein AYW79_10715 [Ferroacidibacillus organovorans]|uniref:Sulfatase N-terminal domain-containing protein n=2 Tax=Ferroacidibacillus organovorans TaxID=1765683 RepID=A0A853K8T4_9BACL|nr:sulfatase [Ferroacidibacillus organovorans]OAG93406.1 hypothetical protein AYW79_10715 [Ferroacidibacillus organovorans]